MQQYRLGINDNPILSDSIAPILPSRASLVKMLKTDIKTSCTNKGNAPILFLMSGYCKPNFACQNIQESVDCDKKIVLSLTDFEKSNCFAALIFDKRILPYSPRGGIQMFREALAPAGTYAPKLIINLLLCLTLGALCTAAWCSGSGSVPSEIAEPTYGAQSCGCVFIKALQSKDFSEILLICVNFFVAAHGFICFSKQNWHFISLT